MGIVNPKWWGARQVEAIAAFVNRHAPPPLISPKHPLVSKLVEKPVMMGGAVVAAGGGLWAADALAPDGGTAHYAAKLGSSMLAGAVVGGVVGTFVPRGFTCLRAARSTAIRNGMVAGGTSVPALTAVGSAAFDHFLGDERERVRNEVRRQLERHFPHREVERALDGSGDD